MESLSKLSWNVTERLPTCPSPMASIESTRWAVNGANVEMSSNCSYMRRNLIWLDQVHALNVWEGFKTQGYLKSPHNLWDRQHSSCNLIVIIPHSHLWNLFWNCLEISWNIFEHGHYQCHPPMLLGEQWMGPTLKFLQIVLVCVEIWHGWTRSMHLWYKRVLKLKDIILIIAIIMVIISIVFNIQFSFLDSSLASY